MRVIVSGAGGFLGKELVKQMRERDMDFLAATSRPSELIAEVGIQDRSVIDAKQLLQKDTYKEGDVVVNCAFPRTNDGIAMADGLNYLAQLIQCAMKSNASGFVNVSSQSVYSQYRAKPATESDVLDLESSYAVAKRGIELLLEAQSSCIPCTNIRLASLIGPNFNQRVPNRMVETALETGEIRVVDNGSQFGFMDVRDAAGALLRMLEFSTDVWQKTYNLSSGQCWTLTDIAQAIQEAFGAILGQLVEIDRVETQTIPISSLVDSRLFCTEFDWFPIWDKKSTIESIVNDLIGKRL